MFCQELIEGGLSIYQGRILNSGISVEKRKRALHPVTCFDGEIRQVLNNLVSNAIDAMHPKGGRLASSEQREHQLEDRPEGARADGSGYGPGNESGDCEENFRGVLSRQKGRAELASDCGSAVRSWTAMVEHFVFGAASAKGAAVQCLRCFCRSIP